MEYFINIFKYDNKLCGSFYNYYVIMEHFINICKHDNTLCGSFYNYYVIMEHYRMRTKIVYIYAYCSHQNVSTHKHVKLD